MVLEKIPGYHSSRDAAFFKEQLAIFDRMLRLDNVPAKKIKKDITQLNQILIGVIAQQILRCTVNNGHSHFKKLLKLHEIF
jgi:hypothetical protein